MKLVIFNKFAQLLGDVKIQSPGCMLKSHMLPFPERNAPLPSSFAKTRFYLLLNLTKKCRKITIKIKIFAFHCICILILVILTFFGKITLYDQILHFFMKTFKKGFWEVSKIIFIAFWVLIFQFLRISKPHAFNTRNSIIWVLRPPKLGSSTSSAKNKDR